MFNPHDQRWAKQSTGGTEALGRKFHAACALSPSLLLVSGGCCGSGYHQNDYLQDCWVFNFSTMKWSEVMDFTYNLLICCCAIKCDPPCEKGAFHATIDDHFRVIVIDG